MTSNNMIRRAVLDYGTNSLKLVLCELKNGQPARTLLDTERIIRLGKNVVETGLLTDDDVNRALQATGELLDEAREFCPSSIDSVGTWVMRQCENRSLLTKALERKYRMRLRILSETEEANCGLLSILSEQSEPASSNIACFDLGGGSAELTISESKQIQTAISLPMGSRKLMHEVPVDDPPTIEQYKQVVDYVQNGFKEIEEISKATELFLVGGAATMLAGCAKAIEGAEGDIVARTLSVETLDRLAKRLQTMPLSERRKIPGVNPDKADIIFHGAITLSGALRALGRNEATISLAGLPHGFLYAEQLGRALDTTPDVYAMPFNNRLPVKKKRTGEVLFLLRRPDGCLWLQSKTHYEPDTFRIPGGGLKKKESPLECVRREVLEETGFGGARPIQLATLDYQLEGNETPERWFSHLFLVDIGHHIPHPEDDSEGIERWIAVHPCDFGDYAAQLDAQNTKWATFRATALKKVHQLWKNGTL